MSNYKRMGYKKYIECINIISNNLELFIKNNNLKIDYICPILRSGAMSAVYLSNKLNIVKFAPIQVKHVAYNNGTNKIEILFSPFNSIIIKKRKPVFLLVETLHSTGTSAKMCIKEIKNRYKDAIILYVCIAKEYGSQSFTKDTIYEDTSFYYNGSNNFNKEKCKELNIDYFHPLFPWEDLEMEINHPDDLEENIYF